VQIVWCQIAKLTLQFIF